MIVPIQLGINPIDPVQMSVNGGEAVRMSVGSGERVAYSAEEARIIHAVSPKVEMEEIEGGTELTITDIDGAHVTDIMNGADGQDGQDGQDGYSPSASVSKSGDTATITITDANGTTTAEISDGQDGQDGADGQDGQDGADGASAYVWIKWSATEPTQDSDMKSTADKWIGIYSGDSSTAPTAYTSYTWYQYKGDTGAAGQDGSDGQDGADGTSAYVWIKYAAAQPTQDSDMKDTADAWMGVYSGASPTAPTTYTSYTWYRIKGEDGQDGQDGQDGTNGTDGTSAYVWVRWSASQPAQDSDMKTTPDAWIGIYSGPASTAPTAYTSYTWYKYKGDKGDTGSTGATGPGVPSGGSSGQILKKNSGTDYDTAWTNQIVVSDSLTDTSTTNALSAAKGKTLNDHINVQNAVAWKTYPGANGRYCYYYEGVNAATYDLPTQYCFVVVEWMNSARGTAMAYKWAHASGEVYTNALHDSWRGWVQIASGVQSFASIIDGQTLTKTETQYNTYNSRNLASYSVYYITVSIEGYVRESAVLRASIIRNTNYPISLNYTSGGAAVEVVIKKLSDTAFNMKYNCSATKTVTVWIEALA